MIRKISKTKMIQRLELLHAKVESKTSIPIVLDLEKWLDSDDQCSSFGKYALNCGNKNPNARIIIDDMVIQTDMYIDTGLILDSDRETTRSFVNLATQGDEVQYMKAYIELFHDCTGVEDIEPWEEHIKKLGFYNEKTIFENGRWLTKEECLEQSYQNELKYHEMEIQVAREVLSELSNSFYLDFFDHYKKLSVAELIERYKDQRFFEPQTT